MPSLSGRAAAVLLIAAWATGAAAQPAKPLTLALSASRLAGVAPLAVFFDTTATVGSTPRPFHDIEYRWDFGDAKATRPWGAGATAGTGSRNTAIGPLAAHVYETPGEYTVTVTATDGAATQTRATRVLVQDPDVVFSGNATICFSSTGTFADAPEGFCRARGVTAITASGFDQVLQYAGPGRRLLLRRGESWSLEGRAVLNTPGPGILGAFGSGRAPVVRANAKVVLLELSGQMPRLHDWRVMDIDFDGRSIATAGVSGEGAGNQITLLRLGFRDVNGGGIGFGPSRLNYYNRTAPGRHAIWDQLAIVDSVVQRTDRSGGYIGARRLAFLGNVLEDMIGVAHGVRFPYLHKAVIAHNSISRPGKDQSVVKMPAPEWGRVGVEAEGGGYSKQILFSDNKLTSGVNGWMFELQPQSRDIDERLLDVVVERNWFKAGPATTQILMVSGTELTLRNNLIDLSGAASKRGFSIGRFGDCAKACEPVPSRIRVYHNTFYGAGKRERAVLVEVRNAATQVSVQNNLAFVPETRTPTVLKADAADIVASHNSSNEQALAAPGFVVAAPSAPADFRLAPGGAKAGTPLPVYSDFFGVSRPPLGARDLGAFERP